MTTSTLIYLLSMSMVFITLLVVGIMWAIKNGQFDDLEGPAQRILMDEDDPMLPENQKKKDAAERQQKAE